MRIDLCRKCGCEQRVNKTCDICKQGIEFTCINCNSTTETQFHLQCCAVSFDYHLLDAMVE